MNRAREDARKNKVSPKGALSNVSGLLDARRIQYNIPDSVFDITAVYDRILVYQVLKEEREFMDEAGLIIKTRSWQSAERRSTPSGVIISAGCEALDILKSNGMDIGHLVFYTQLAFYRIPVDTILGEDINLVVLRVGEVVGSIDLANALQKRLARIVPKERELPNGSTRVEHCFVDSEGKRWDPVLGFSPDDL